MVILGPPSFPRTRTPLSAVPLTLRGLSLWLSLSAIPLGYVVPLTPSRASGASEGWPRNYEALFIIDFLDFSVYFLGFPILLLGFPRIVLGFLLGF